MGRSEPRVSEAVKLTGNGRRALLVPDRPPAPSVLDEWMRVDPHEIDSERLARWERVQLEEPTSTDQKTQQTKDTRHPFAFTRKSWRLGSL
jgi:hypothetical protein